MAKKSAAAKNRAREREKVDNISPKPPTSESSSSSEAGTEPANTQPEHDSASNVVSALGSLPVNTGEFTSDVLQSAVSHSARLPEEEPAIAGAVDGPCFDVKPAPGKGLGVLAIGDIPRGTRIISEKPLPNNATQRSDIQGPFERLSAKSRTRFLQLADAHFTSSSPIRSIFLADRVDLGDSAAVFVTISRLNHSCLQNTDYAFNVLNGETTAQAFKDIKKEEEILISYAHPYWTAIQRKEQELKYYDFDCDCMACAPLSVFWGKSDTIREEARCMSLTKK